MTTIETIASFADVDRRSELAARPPRAPDHAAVSRVLARLAERMAVDPRSMLQGLAESALELCRADTAGISLLEGDVVRWAGLAGVCRDQLDGTMPRNASPCGVCLDDDATHLMSLPDRRYPALRNDPRFVEALLVPFHAQGRAVGTVWLVSHTAERQFDREDERIANLLSQIAGAGWQLWTGAMAANVAARQRERFLAVLSHELRGPLSSLSLAVSMGRLDPAHRAHALEVAARQCKHLTRLVDDMLDVARVTEGKFLLERGIVAIADVVDLAVSNSQAPIAERRHVLHVSVPATRLQLHADGVRLVQIVTNLLVNAAKYTPAGGRIDLVVERRDGGILLSVRDTGIGIPATMLPRVFELFAQVGSEHGDGGLGVGLSIVKRLVELHGGSVSAASDGIGRGSTFTVLLPMLASIERSRAGVAPAAAVSCRSTASGESR